MRFTRLLRYVATECGAGSKLIPEIKSPPNAKVTVWGSCYLTHAVLLDLKLSPLLDEIRIFDKKEEAQKLSEDLNQIATNSTVIPYYGAYQIGCALQDVDVILLAGGEFGAPGESKHCIFMKNLPGLLDMAYECAHHNPKAAVVVLTPPGSRNVPMISELYEKVGIHDPGRIMAPMYQFEMMASRIIAEHLNLPNNVVSLPIVGGCCSDTFIPIFSQASPQNEFTDSEITGLIEAIRAEPHHVSSKQKGQPPSLGPAMATSKLILDIVRGRFSMPQKRQTVFLRSDVLLNIKYLGTPVQFGPAGVSTSTAMPQLSEAEFKFLAEAVVQLQEDARIGAAAAAAKWNEIE